MTLAGSVVTEVIAQRSSSGQYLPDEAKAAIVKSQGKADGRILHLQYGGQVLAPHRHLGDSGVDDVAILTGAWMGLFVTWGPLTGGSSQGRGHSGVVTGVYSHMGVQYVWSLVCIIKRVCNHKGV